MKKLSFGKILLIYAAVFMVIIAVVGVVVWNKLSDYQKDYDEAKAAGSPKLFAEELVAGWNYEAVTDYIESYGVDNLGEYNNKEVLADIFAGKSAKISYSANEKYTEVMPVYDIYSGTTRLAVVSLKPEGTNDEFGFHKWQIRDLVFDTNNLETTNYTIKVTSDCKVVVNGEALTEDNVKSTYQNLDTLTKWVGEKYGHAIEYTEYELGACVSLPEIKVTDAAGNEITECVVKEDLVEYNCTSTPAFIEAVEPRVFDTTHAYISNIYYKLTFYQLSKYLVANSDAYVIIKDVQSSIAWGWHPDVVEIIEESVSNYVEYSDTLFSCDYYAKIYKADADEEYEEIFNYQLLFEKVGEEYYLTYFNLK